MATPIFNSKSPTIKRILKEAAELSQSPSPDYHASPASDSDLFDWHFTLRGPPSTASIPSPYANGIYHGRIVLPPTYPLRPPSFRFLTPSGRFEVNREICLSISGHHEETWQPAWGIRTALVALRAFMESDAKGQVGGLECSSKERERFAGSSMLWKCVVCGRNNGEIIAECEAAAKEKEDAGEKRQEVEVPKDLKLGWKDEMKSQGDAEKMREGDRALLHTVDTDTELAEGFVRTGPVETESSISNAYPPARPMQGVPQPTSSTPQSQPAPRPTPAARLPPLNEHQQRNQLGSNGGVPMWIDRTIAGIVVCLVVMVLKVMLGI